MASGISIQIKGLEEFLKKTGTKADRLKQFVEGEIHATTIEITNAQASKAPVDKGVLKRSIFFIRTGQFSYEIVSGARYSAYQEFGTGNKVRIPNKYQKFAAQFKGRGIRKHNMDAKPYFIPPLQRRANLLVKRISNFLKIW